MTLHLNRFFAIYAGGKVRKPGYTRGLLKNAFKDWNYIPDQAVSDLDNYLEQRSNFYSELITSFGTMSNSKLANNV